MVTNYNNNIILLYYVNKYQSIINYTLKYSKYRIKINIRRHHYSLILRTTDNY